MYRKSTLSLPFLLVAAILVGCANRPASFPAFNEPVKLDSVVVSSYVVEYDPEMFSRAEAAFAAGEMNVVSIDVAECLSEVYGTPNDGLNISRVLIIDDWYITPEGYKKRGECRATDPVTCIYMWDHTLDYWAGEMESVYRLRIFGLDKVYDRTVPTPELYREGKQCLR